MNTVSLVGSISRLAGGMFESVRRLNRELLHESARIPERQLSVGFPQSNRLAQSVARPGMTVQVLSLRDEFSERDLGAWAPVPVRLFGCYGPRAFGFAPALARELDQLKPDLVHVHGLWQFSSAAARAWHGKTRKPYLVSPHGMLEPWALRNSAWKKALGWFAFERTHLSSARCIRALCENEACAIRGLGLTNPICVIPNGVDIPPLGNRSNNGKLSDGAELETAAKEIQYAEAFNHLKASRKLLLYLGRIHPKKGLPNLLKAWAGLRASAEWVLVIAGWDQQGHEGELRRLADELHIGWSDGTSEIRADTSLLFPGPQFGAAKEEWLRRCDGFILPSFGEGVPTAVLEAWAHGKPVLMTPQCNLPEGFATAAALCIEPSPDSIAGGLQEFFRLNAREREEIGSRGLALVSANFAWWRLAADLKAVYRWVAAAGPKPACVLTS